jgi:hypothetical protein
VRLDEMVAQVDGLVGVRLAIHRPALVIGRAVPDPCAYLLKRSAWFLAASDSPS